MKDNLLYLTQILECILKIERYTSRGKERFLKSLMAQDAVYKNFENIGEAARRLEKNFHSKHPQVNWSGVIGLRNIIAHQYDGVDPEEIWDITRDQMKTLKIQIKEILKRAL
jgi:uncharacterized protein with HEPN domain